MSENGKGVKRRSKLRSMQWKLVENSRWTVVMTNRKPRCMCHEIPVTVFSVLVLHSIPLFSPVLFAVCVCVIQFVAVAVFPLPGHFTTLIYVFAFVECHLQNDTETFSMFHSVNVLINIMTHSICMMSQLAHFLCHSLNSLAKAVQQSILYTRHSPQVTLFCALSLLHRLRINHRLFVRAVGRSLVHSVDRTDGRTDEDEDERTVVGLCSTFRFKNSIWNI